MKTNLRRRKIFFTALSLKNTIYNEQLLAIVCLYSTLYFVVDKFLFLEKIFRKKELGYISDWVWGNLSNLNAFGLWNCMHQHIIMHVTHTQKTFVLYISISLAQTTTINFLKCAKHCDNWTIFNQNAKIAWSKSKFLRNRIVIIKVENYALSQLNFIFSLFHPTFDLKPVEIIASQPF